ncbi:MAG: LAGLIDADG family homing endonuclease [Candidatus Aenigmatarchaeota archaeon]
MEINYEIMPYEPQVPLKNYLLNLVSPNDSKENSIYLRNVESFIKEIWNEIVEMNWRKLNVRELIPKELGISCSIFYAHKNGRKSISIQLLFKLLKLWEKYCNKSNDQVKQKWDEIFNSNKISEKNKQQLELILSPLIKNLFGINVPIFIGYGNGYRIQFGNKPIHRFLTKVLKIKTGEVPRFIKKLDEANKRYFLMGIFDSEGCVSKSRNRLIISQAKLSFLEEIIELLNEMNIYPNGPTFHKTKLGVWYEVRVESKEEFLKFAKNIGSNHVEKFKLLQMWVNKIENRDGRSSSSFGDCPKMAI